MTLPKILPAILLIMMTAVSCTTLTEKQTADISADGNFENQLVSAGNTMLKAFRENDSRLFSQQLSGELKKEFGTDSFETGRKQITKSAGNIQNCRLLGILKGPVFTSALWAVKFEKSGADKKITGQELLFKLTAARLDDKLKIVSFGFMP